MAQLSSAMLQGVSKVPSIQPPNIMGQLSKGQADRQQMQMNEQKMQARGQLMDINSYKLKAEESKFIQGEVDTAKSAEMQRQLSEIDYDSEGWEDQVERIAIENAGSPEEIMEISKFRRETERDEVKLKKLNAELKNLQAKGRGEGGKAPSFQNAGIAIGPKGEKVPVAFNPDPSIKGGRFTNATTGEPLEEGFIPIKTSVQGSKLEAISGTEAKELRNSQVSAENFVRTAGDAIKMLEETPNINTFVAKSAAIINDLQQEASAIREQMGVDASITDPNSYQGAFDQLGIENERMKGLITSLAFQAAAASGQTGRAISNKDIERFIKEVGANSADPRAMSKVLRDVVKRTTRNFKTNFRVRTGSDFEGSLGLDSISPEEKPVNDMSKGELDAEIQRLEAELGTR